MIYKKDRFKNKKDFLTVYGQISKDDKIFNDLNKPRFDKFTTYEYDNRLFKSSWQLAYYVFLKDTNNTKLYKEKEFNKEFIKKNKGDILGCVQYIYKQYGLTFFENHKIKKITHSKGKRKIIPLSTIEELYKYPKKKHYKYSYNCEVCGKFHITAWRILDHFKDLKCKKCRKEKAQGSNPELQ
jgi:hypothetical protein